MTENRLNRWTVLVVAAVIVLTGYNLLRHSSAQPRPRVSDPQTTATTPVTGPVATVKVVQYGNPNGDHYALFELAFDTRNKPVVQKEPTFEVRDSSGTKVHQGKFEFG